MKKTLLDVAPYRVAPPISGGTLAIHHANLAVSRYWSVRLISQGIRRNEVRKAYLIPFTAPPSYSHNSSYREDCVFSLPSVVAGYYTGQRSGGLLLSANWTLRLTRPTVLFSALDEATVLQVEHPWQVPILARWNHGRRPLVMVAHNVETLVGRQLRWPRQTVEAIRRREAEAAAESDAVIVFTESDRASLIEVTGVDSSRIHPIPLGVDLDRLAPPSVDQREQAKKGLGLSGKRVALFVGALYEPNVEAVSALFEIAERMDRNDLVFVVVGRVGERFRSNDQVLVTGQVDDVLPYFSAADFAVNPMRSGGGMQVKLLEFLAAGLPTVTTPIGARGLTVSSGNELVIADQDCFPDALDLLLKDEAIAAMIGANGRRLVEARHSWDAVARERIALYGALVQGTR